MDHNRLAQIALSFIPGVGHMLSKQLISYCGSATAVLNAPKNKLLKIPGVGPATVNSILSKSTLKTAEDELNLCAKNNARILLYNDEDFPKRLRHINDAPSLLYVKGNADFNKSKVISIVGTRKATDYGKNITEKLVEELIPHDPLIISGLAYGIDITAHRAALKNGLSTIGVMASGINIVYPAVHKSTAIKMQETGAIITENTIDSKPDAPKFPARNRIIAGMADAILVIEAAKKGGALITAEIGNGYNKDVFAVPGNLQNEASEGCNALIKSHKAHLLQSVKDLEYIMNWEASNEQKPNIQLTIDDLDPEEQLVILELQKHKESIMIDNLSWQTQLPLNRLASILLNLEFKGYVSSLPGKRFGLTTK